MHAEVHVATGPVVWYMAAAKTYYLKGSSHYGKGMGMYVCRATAVARGGHPGDRMMGGSHGSMGGSHGSMGGSHGSMGGSARLDGRLARDAGLGDAERR